MRTGKQTHLDGVLRDLGRSHHMKGVRLVGDERRAVAGQSGLEQNVELALGGPRVLVETTRSEPSQRWKARKVSEGGTLKTKHEGQHIPNVALYPAALGRASGSTSWQKAQMVFWASLSSPKRASEKAPWKIRAHEVN